MIHIFNFKYQPYLRGLATERKEVVAFILDWTQPQARKVRHLVKGQIYINYMRWWGIWVKKWYVLIQRYIPHRISSTNQSWRKDYYHWLYAVINHETIHVVLMELEGSEICCAFDMVDNRNR